MKTSKEQSESFKKYNALIHPQRIDFMLSPGINTFMAQSTPKKLHAFLLVWTGFSIKMTEKVESWISRAGESCETMNYNEVGNRLKYHANQEAGHDLMLVADLKVLIQKWNTLYNDNITEDDIFNLNVPYNTNEYVALHENTIQGKHPYTQVAIEYEIERISVMYGPKIIENVTYTLGEDFESAISFLTDHVLIDQGHTKFNIDLLEKCLAAKGDLNELVKTGGSALKIYAGFLNECIKLSAAINEREQWTSQLTN